MYYLFIHTGSKQCFPWN